MRLNKQKKLIIKNNVYDHDSGDLSSDLTIFKENYQKPIGWLWVWTIKDLLELEGCSHDKHSYNIKNCNKPKKISAGFSKEKHGGHYDYTAIFDLPKITIEEYVKAIRYWSASEGYNNYDLEFILNFMSNTWQEKNIKYYGYRY